jgi:predicted HAD superfamily hydrolase
LLYTFDIFDTLLTRPVGRPGTVFSVLKRRLLSQGMDPAIAGAVPEIRSKAQWDLLARTRAEVTLDEIYQEMARLTDWPAPTLDAIRATEVALEEELLRPVPAGIARLHRARQEGRSIAFLSDMYLPEEFIERQLVRHGLYRDGDRLFVSSSNRKRKHDGDLYTHTAQELGVPAGDCVHTGNCPRSDVASAQRMGWGCHPFPQGNLNRYEKLLDDGDLGSLLAGASRLARLDQEPLDPHLETVQTIAASVAGPFMSAYLLWIFREAREAGLKRLYFLSRDGHILLQMARVLAPKMGCDLELRYLHASRQAWHLPSLSGELDDHAVFRLLTRGTGLTLDSIPKRIGFEEAEFDAHTQSSELRDVPRSAVLDASQEAALVDLLRTPSVAALIATRAGEARSTMMEYLAQEGLLDDDRWGLVDLGWLGRLQDSLAEILHLEGHPIRPHGFYVGLFPRKKKPEWGTYKSFLHRQHQQDPGLPRMGTHLELFCSADHGRTCSYRSRGERVVPTMDDPPSNDLCAWGFAMWQDTLVRYAEHLELGSDLVDAEEDVSDRVCAALLELVDRPTPEEARCLGLFPFETGMTDSKTVRLIQPLGWGDFMRSAAQCRVPAALYGRWPAGSIAASSPRLRRAFATLAPLYAARKTLGRLARALRSKRP